MYCILYTWTLVYILYIYTYVFLNVNSLTVNRGGSTSQRWCPVLHVAIKTGNTLHYTAKGGHVLPALTFQYHWLKLKSQKKKQFEVLKYTKKSKTKTHSKTHLIFKMALSSKNKKQRLWWIHGDSIPTHPSSIVFEVPSSIDPNLFRELSGWITPKQTDPLSMYITYEIWDMIY